MSDMERSETRYAEGMDVEAFDQQKSKLKSALQAAIGPQWKHYMPASVGRKRGFQLKLPHTSVRFEAIVETRE